MKKIIILLFCMAPFTAIFAQTPQFVSTKKLMQTTLYEETTGQRCQNCATAHRVLNEIDSTYKGIVSYNIHCLSLAVPLSPFYPIDFRTENGDSIVSRMYAYQDSKNSSPTAKSTPTNMINRKLYNYPSDNTQRILVPMGTSATLGSIWKTVAQENQGKSQIANVAVKQTIDSTTRELVVSTEVYYTEGSVKPINYLNVLLIQDSIIGRQENSANNPSQEVFYDGIQSYYQMHVLRDYITDINGDSIANTTADAFFSKEYKYTLPDSIRNIPIVLNHMRVIAFVTEDFYGTVLCSAYPGIEIPLSANSVEKESLLAQKFTISPNPAKQFTNVSFFLEKGSNVEVVVYNVYGKKVLTLPKAKYNKGQQEIRLDTQKLPAGAYAVVINTDLETVSKKLMIQK